MVYRVSIFAFALVFCLSAYPDDDGMAFYTSQVAPLLQTNCLKCHGGGDVLKSGLNLKWRTGVLKGGDRGPAVDLGTPASSLMLDMISYRDAEHSMPPDGKLSDAQIGVLTEWIKRGLPMPDVPPKNAPAKEHKSPYNNKVCDETRNWWAYKPVVRPAVPTVADPAWNANPIDAFIYAKLQDAGLKPAPEATWQTLIRRLYYDVTGLPPSPVEVDAFVSDADPAAYEKMVDRLLASPHYGEAWGRHWLDVVRYAETNGYERDNPKPFIWRYRDYVIQAFNNDKPYDRFVREQLAGDELPDGGVDGIIATGYYRLGLWDDEPVDKKQGRYDVLDGVVSTTGEAFLGMTMGCCRCHDHKIDPIPQKDYYKLLAFFDNVTNMDTTQITRSILTGDEAAAYAKATDDKSARVAEAEKQVRAAQVEFAAALRKADPNALPPAQPSEMSGLHYKYFRGAWDKLPDFNALKPESEGVIADGFFDLETRNRNDGLGYVFEGKLAVPKDGEYTFFIDSDDGSRISIDGNKVLEYDGVHVLGREQQAKATLTTGEHTIRLDYFQRAENLGLRVWWKGPDFDRHALSNDLPKADLPELINARGTVVSADFSKHFEELKAHAEAVRGEEVPGAKYAACVEEYGPVAPVTHVHFRGNPNAPGDEVAPGFPEILGTPAPALPTPPPDSPTTMRRTVLADWIASPSNPMTARVFMNRVWQFHFGRGIARTPNDFGQAGIKPTHPELLDWLASEFMSDGWTVKRMQKMILMSHTYRMSNAYNEEAHTKDPGNNLFWRFDMRRLTAEEVRDSILALNGSINLEVGGPSVYPPMPEEVLHTSSQPGNAWKSSPPEQYTRRSVYIHVKRSLLTPLLTDFDLADTDTSCPVRFATTQPLQALNLMNSQFADDQAKVFEQRLERERPDVKSRVQYALTLATGHAHSDADVNEGLNFLNGMELKYHLDERTALERFALLVMNLNEFVYLD